MSLTSRAFHEAGHAVVGHLMGGRVEALTLRPGHGGDASVSIFPAVKDGMVDYFANAATKLAGPIAERMAPERVRPARPDRLTDCELRHVIGLERGLWKMGLSSDYRKALPPIAVVAASGLADGEYLWRAARRARTLLRQHWAAVEAVRKASMRRRAHSQLTGDEIRDLVVEHGQNSDNPRLSWPRVSR